MRYVLHIKCNEIHCHRTVSSMKLKNVSIPKKLNFRNNSKRARLFECVTMLPQSHYSPYSRVHMNTRIQWMVYEYRTFVINGPHFIPSLGSLMWSTIQHSWGKEGVTLFPPSTWIGAHAEAFLGSSSAHPTASRVIIKKTILGNRKTGGP